MRRLVPFSCLLLCVPSVAHAQATSNAITGANDAFGFRKGDEAVGIYDEAFARGFSLESAGNYRVHGTYFVKNSGVSSFFLESTAVRIGFNTLGVTLPSPSGVVDYSLRDPAKGEPSLFTLGLDQFNQPYAEMLFKHRSARVPLSGTFGVAVVPQLKDAQGGASGDSLLLAGTARFHHAQFDVRLFGGEYRFERPSQFRLVTDEALLDREMERGRFIGVDGMNDKGQRHIAGLLADTALTRRIGLGATTVFTQEDPSKTFLTLFSGLADDDTVVAKIIATPAQKTTSISSEARLYWIAGDDASGDEHRIDVLGRFRRTRSGFGGATIHNLGRVAFDEPLDLNADDFDPDGEAGLRDRINQYGAGLSYRARFGRWRVNAGVLRTSYRKAVSGTGIAESDLQTSKWLYNLSAAYRLADWVEIYAGHSRGLEEAGVAPASASNRYEVLSPAAARQYEIAAILRPFGNFNLSVGAFDLERGYFGADMADGRYKQLGRVRHRGIELSGAGTLAPGLTVILGGVALDPVVRTDGGEEFRPIGVPKIRLLASADYEFMPKIHADATVQFTGNRQATHKTDASNNIVPASWTANVGLRSPFGMAKLKSTVRFQLLNIFNSYSWDVSSAGTMAYSPSRRFRLAVTTEF
ncbi:MAG: TonB-dependent receptor domain-containing protein [Sphingomicrobium sp.]